MMADVQRADMTRKMQTVKMEEREGLGLFIIANGKGGWERKKRGVQGKLVGLSALLVPL